MHLFAFNLKKLYLTEFVYTDVASVTNIRYAFYLVHI